MTATGQKRAGKYSDSIAVYLAVTALLALAFLLRIIEGAVARALFKYAIYVAIAAVPVVACILGKKPVFKTLGFKKGSIARQLILVLPVFAATVLVFVVIPMVCGVPKSMLLGGKPADTTALVLQVIHLMVFVGLGEEIVFRGYLFERLKADAKSGVRAAVLTAAGFGLWHFPVNQDFLQILLTALIGLIYGFARMRFRNCSTLTVAVAHGLHDTFILVMGLILL